MHLRAWIFLPIVKWRRLDTAWNNYTPHRPIRRSHRQRLRSAMIIDMVRLVHCKCYDFHVVFCPFSCTFEENQFFIIYTHEFSSYSGDALCHDAWWFGYILILILHAKSMPTMFLNIFLWPYVYVYFSIQEILCLRLCS